MECWICLSDSIGLESSYCGCSASVRPVHARCLGRWQLQRAGTREETHCRFCNSKYQLDWRTSLAAGSSETDSNSSIASRAAPSAAPAAAAAAAAAAPQLRRAPTPVMAIIFEGQVHRIKVYPGPEGKARFQQQIRELVKLRDDEEFEVEFECKAPDSGAVLHLDGMDAFDAATHCASLTAAERLTRQQQQQQQDQQQEARQGQQQHGVTADVSLQVAAQHSTADSCPHSTAQHGVAAAGNGATQGWFGIDMSRA